MRPGRSIRSDDGGPLCMLHAARPTALCLVDTWRLTTRVLFRSWGHTSGCMHKCAGLLSPSVPPLRFITQFYIHAENHLTTLRFCRWRHDISPKHQQHDPYTHIVTMQQHNHNTIFFSCAKNLRPLLRTVCGRNSSTIEINYKFDFEKICKVIYVKLILCKLRAVQSKQISQLM
jgi:hypothetical protein